MSRSLPPLVVSLFVAGIALAMQAPRAAAISPPGYITQWGTSGSGNTQFLQPSGVATDGAGFVYVADTGNNRIVKYTTAGAYVSQWGSAGSGNGQFSGPFGLTVVAGKVYVVDTGNARVQVFTTAGAYTTQWGSLGTGNGQFQQPLCVALDASGNVYVTDYNLNRVQKFTNTGTYLTQWGTTGTGFMQFSGMAGISIDAFGGVSITDSGNDRIEVFSTGGIYTTMYGGPGTGNGQFSYPLGIATDGVDEYVVDTMNNRVQMLTNVGTYLTQWGILGGGNGQFNGPHAAAADAGFIYVADTEQDRIQKFGFAPIEDCTQCEVPPDTCCEALPTVGGPWTNIVVGTREPSPFLTNLNCVVIYNLNATALPAEDNDWASMTRYSGPGNSWNGDSLGTVFGLTLDEYGNIFVTHTSCYSSDAIGQVFNAGPGAVYRIDGVTGKITTFCKLPNFLDGSVSPPENLPGLGNITYDCTHKQFFVTNIEDGKIYRIKPTGVNGPTGTVVETFDPLVPDNALAGWAPIGERLWGVQWHGNRVYYSVWAQDNSEGTGPNEIRSIGLLPSGAFATSTDKHELNVPPLKGRIYSNPVSDISFSVAGKMLLGERSISFKSYPGAHDARVLEYACSAGCWLPANQYGIGDYYAKENAAGGVDYDGQPFSGPSGTLGRVWATGDAIHLFGAYTDIIYGLQGLRPNLPIGSNLNSMLIDSDGIVNNGDKTYIGDVEAPGCGPVTTGAICGQKFYDANHNGVKDGTELGLSNWTIQLNGPGGPYTATTDASGNYCFTGLQPGTYVINEVNISPWVQMAPAGGIYTVTLAAGQTLLAKDFGNFACGSGVGGGCVNPPPLMAAWWPFNENTTSTTAGDVTHTSPPHNVALLSGGAAISNSGQVGRALCFSSELDYARVPNANQVGINFNTSPFAIDAWVNPNSSSAANRTIAEKRKLISTTPYRTLGWALYMNGQQLFLEIGIGIAAQIVPGPTIPAGTWTHIAVSVDRVPAAGKWYVNGALLAAFNFVPTSGPISNTADLYLGHASPGFPVSLGFQGCIDELELLTTPSISTLVLPAASVAAIYNAGVIGKCREYVLMPQVTTICKTQTSVQVCFNICNNTATPQSYHWSMAGLPIGPGCSVAGPVVFNPAAGTVVVPPGSCSPPICVTIPRPAGLTTQNATSCYTLSFVNDATGECHTAKATIRADYSCWCITPPTGIATVSARVAGTGISIPVTNPCDPISTPYRLVAVWLNTDHEDPHAVSLNGLPPGEPVFGTLSVGPGGGDSQVSVNVSYPNGYDFSAPYEIAMEADLDGDGVEERIGGTVVVSSDDSSHTTGVTPPTAAIENIRLVTAPNPFLVGSAVSFSLARPDDVELGVYDLTGRAVRTLQRGRLVAGAHRFEWNGRDAEGRRVAAGVYFVRLEATGRHLESKLVKLQ